MCIQVCSGHWTKESTNCFFLNLNCLLSVCAPKTVFTCVWMINKKNIRNAPNLQCSYSMYCISYGTPKYTMNISIPLGSMNLCGLFVWWLICELFSPYVQYTSNVLYCHRSPLKSGQSLAPVVKPNNLIPPNVPPFPHHPAWVIT